MVFIKWLRFFKGIPYGNIVGTEAVLADHKIETFFRKAKIRKEIIKITDLFNQQRTYVKQVPGV